MSDLIERQKAIDAIEREAYRHTYLDQITGIIAGLPSAQRWIPVTEALPEAGVEVWVTIKGHDVIRCENGETLEQAIDRISKIRWVTRGYWSEEEHGWNDPSFGCPLIVQPIAWMPMPLPEPYKGGEHETD